MNKKITRALVSVSDKTGIVEFCRALNQFGIEILSTGGTFKTLTENNITAIEVSDYTGFPEMMDGRVKTLHPKVHGGILGRRNRARFGSPHADTRVIRADIFDGDAATAHLHDRVFAADRQVVDHDVVVRPPTHGGAVFAELELPDHHPIDGDNHFWHV